jgi:hypothetical protein
MTPKRRLRPSGRLSNTALHAMKKRRITQRQGMTGLGMTGLDMTGLDMTVLDMTVLGMTGLGMTGQGRQPIGRVARLARCAGERHGALRESPSPSKSGWADGPVMSEQRSQGL